MYLFKSSQTLSRFCPHLEQRNSNGTAHCFLWQQLKCTPGCGMRMLPGGPLTACDARGQAGHGGYLTLIHQQSCLFLHLHPAATSAFLWSDQAQLASLFFCLQKILPPHRPRCFSCNECLLAPDSPAYAAHGKPGLIPGRGHTCNAWEWERHQVQELKTKQGITGIIAVSIETIKTPDFSVSFQVSSPQSWTDGRELEGSSGFAALPFEEAPSSRHSW